MTRHDDRRWRSYWNTRDDGTYVSGFVGPFGGPFPLISDGSVYEDLTSHLTHVRRNAETAGASELRTRLPPKELWHDVVSSIERGLLKDNWFPSETNIGHVVDLKHWTKSHLRRDRRRNYRSSSIQGLEVKSGLSLSQEVSEVISCNRRRKGLKNYIDPDQIQCIFSEDPQNANLLIVHDASMGPIAGSYSFGIDEEVAYVAQWGHIQTVNGVSPMTLVAVEVIEWAQSMGFTTLFLGLSSLGGQIDNGLADFKESLGAHRVSLETWSFNLEETRFRD